jgi:sortase A
MINDRLFRKKIIAPTIFVFGVIIFLFVISRGFFYTSNNEIKFESLSNIVVPRTEVGFPVRIVIPKIDLDTEVEQVGITYKGNMSTPKSISNTGWYKYGTVPGEIGSSVIDGHVDNGFNMPGVFSELKKLSPGDDIYVRTDKKEELHFVVVEKEVYPFKEVPLQKLFNRNDLSRLNLITCDGEWIDEEQTDENRLVVYAKLVE